MDFWIFLYLIRWPGCHLIGGFAVFFFPEMNVYSGR